MIMQINNYDYSPVYILPYIFDSIYTDSLVLKELKEWAVSDTQFEMNIDSSGAAAWAVFIKNLVYEDQIFLPKHATINRRLGRKDHSPHRMHQGCYIFCVCRGQRSSSVSSKSKMSMFYLSCLTLELFGMITWFRCVAQRKTT